MFITWHGHSCFKLQEKEQVMVIDPYDQHIAGKPPIIKKADVILLTDRSLADAKKFKNSLVIDHPGEYETKGIFIQGIPTSDGKTIYFFEFGGLTAAHLGNIHSDLTEQQKEIIEEVHLLFIPVGGRDVYDFKKASKIIQELEPRVVIPMSYHFPGLKIKADPVDYFRKEEGLKDQQSVERIKLTPKDLPSEKTIFYLLVKQ